MSIFWSTVKAGAKTKTGRKIISALTGGKQKTTGTEVITKVKPTISKELSESARGLRLSGWAKRMRQKLKKD